MPSLAKHDGNAVQASRHQILMDGSLPSQWLDFQTCAAIRLTLSKISDNAAVQTSIKAKEIPGDTATFDVDVAIQLEFGREHQKETASTTFAVEAVRNLRSPIKRTGEQTDHLRMNQASIIRNPRTRMETASESVNCLKRMNPS